MIRRVVAFALNQPLFVALLALLFIGGGVTAFLHLPKAFPDVSDIQVNVVALYPGRAAEEVEKQVTIPIELSLAGLPHNVRMFSHTQFGLSFIVLTFDDNVTDYFARQQVLERLQSADLPTGVNPQLAPLSTPIGELYRYRLRGDRLSPTDLRTLQDWTVSRYLKMTPGVADVVTMGGSIKQVTEVQPDQSKMRYYDVTLQKLATGLSRGNANGGGSYVEQGTQQYLVRGIGLLRSADDIGKIVVTSRGTTPILVEDVAQVVVGGVPRQGVVGQDRDDDVVTGIVLMRKGENPSEVLAALKKRVGELNASVLPKGVTVEPFYDRTWLIQTTLKTVFENLFEGALLVTAVLLLFLGNIRAAAIVALIIPLSLLATFIGLTWRGIPANLLSLGAMDFGIIVDGAVIVVENVFRRVSERQQLGDSASLKETILEATVDVGRPTFFSMLIIIAANIPIFTLQRTEGRIFAPMAWTVTSALIGSLIMSLTLVPLLCYFILRPPLPHEENGVVRACKRVYEPALRWAVRFPMRVLAVAVAALVASLAAATHLGTEFLPELNEGTVWINLNLPPGVSVPETMSILTKARAQLATVPEVTTTVSKAGRPEDGTDPKPINMVEIFVGLKPTSAWRRGVTKEQILAQMDAALAVIPGIEVSFSQPIRDNVLESISQIDGQVVIKIFGDDSDTLHAAARDVLGAIGTVRGVARAFIDRAGEVPQARLEIDRAAAARYGLSVGDIEDQIELTLGGRSVTDLWEGERHFGVVPRLAPADRELSRLDRIQIDAPNGARVPLADVAHYSAGSGSMNISREDGRKVVAIGVFIQDRDMGSVVKDMQDRVKTLKLPGGSTVTWAGEFENQQRAMARLMVIIPISIFIIFALLFNAFQSVKNTLLILLNVPFAMIGGILALLVTGIPLSVSAAIGFIALFGQSVLNGVVMISVFNQLLAAGHTPEQATIDGALLRMRTVLMTALLAMLGLLPMALSHGIGSETQKPLAVVIIGGLVTGTLLVLLVLPALFLAIVKRGAKSSPIVPRAAIAAMLLPLLLCRCASTQSFSFLGLHRPPLFVGEWIDVAKSTPTDTSLWVLKADGYDGNAHLRLSPSGGGWARTETRHGSWYFDGDLADTSNRALCYGKRIGRNGATCIRFAVDTLAGARVRLTLFGYKGEHNTTDRQLVQRH